MHEDPDAQRVFQSAADLFALLAVPLRLRIVSALCQGARAAGELPAATGASDAELAPHLATLRAAGVVAPCGAGWCMRNERVAVLCRTVCGQVALGLDEVGDGTCAVADRVMQPPSSDPA